MVQILFKNIPITQDQKAQAYNTGVVISQHLDKNTIKNITLDIQKRLNEGVLKDTDFSSYTDQLLDSLPVNPSNLPGLSSEFYLLFQSILIMARHSTESDTKFNWFGVNQTQTIQNFIQNLDGNNQSENPSADVNQLNDPLRINLAIQIGMSYTELRTLDSQMNWLISLAKASQLADNIDSLTKFVQGVNLTDPRQFGLIALGAGLTDLKRLIDFVKGIGVSNAYELGKFAYGANISADLLIEFATDAEIKDPYALGRFLSAVRGIPKGFSSYIKYIKSAEIRDPYARGRFLSGMGVAGQFSINFAKEIGIRDAYDLGRFSAGAGIDRAFLYLVPLEFGIREIILVGQFAKGAGLTNYNYLVTFAMDSGIRSLRQFGLFAKSAGIQTPYSLGCFAAVMKVLCYLDLNIDVLTKFAKYAGLADSGELTEYINGANITDPSVIDELTSFFAKNIGNESII